MDSATSSGNDEAVTAIQNLCQVDEMRARDLLEAGSGSIERAVDIFFDLKQDGHNIESSNVSNRRAYRSPNDSRVNKTKRAEPAPKTPATSPTRRADRPTQTRKQQATTTSPSPAKSQKRQQSTLHSFLGMPSPKAKGPKQAKMDSFVASSEKKENFKVSPSIMRSAKDAEKSSIGCLNKDNKEPALGSLLRTGMQSFENLDIPTKNPLDRRDSAARSHDGLPYSVLTERFADMVATTRRNSKLASLQEIFQQVIRSVGGVHMDTPRDDDAYILTCTIDLILGKLSVSKKNVLKESLTLQVSGKSVSAALQTVTGASNQQMKQEYRRTGDLGDVAFKYFVPSSLKSFFGTTTESKLLTIVEVHDLMQQVATVPPGKGSQGARQNLLLKLLRGCQDKIEIRFLVRTLLGNMRLGATLKSVISALAAAVSTTMDESTENAPQQLQETFNISPNLFDISKALLEGGVARASRVCTLVVGYPIQPMLANPAHSLDEVERFMGEEDAVAEWKYDGVRCQAHYDGTQITLYSRHLLDNTAQYPDAVQYLFEAKNKDVNSFICDAEIVGVAPSQDFEDGFRLLPFQDLSTRRGAKSDDGKAIISIRIYSYDLMYLNGISLLREPLWKRQQLLKESFSATPGFGFATSTPIPRYDEEILNESLKRSVAGGAEGLMIKLTGNKKAKERVRDLESDRSYGYESGNRSRLWLKLKRDYVSGKADTIDVVPIGAWFGNGRKAQAGFLSPVLLAVYDEEDDVFRSISRCMSFTDEMYAATRDFYFHGTPYPPHVGLLTDSTVPGVKPEAEIEADDSFQVDSIIANDAIDDLDRVNCYPARPSSAVYVTNESPSVWFKPLEVWEVSFADLTLSKVHPAAAGLVEDSQGRGVALRFPRFIRRRQDKGINMATSTAQIAALYHNQTKVLSKGNLD